MQTNSVFSAIASCDTAVNNAASVSTVKVAKTFKLDATTRAAAAATKRVSRLRQRLHTGIVEFYFRKKDGSLRHAFGTTVGTLIESHIKGTGKSGEQRHVVTFWDVEKADWRSCTYNSIVTIVPKTKMTNPGQVTMPPTASAD